MAEKVGFVGLGDIGYPMALQLKKSGYEVVVFDMDEEKRQQAVEDGLTIVNSNKEIAERVDHAVLSSVVDKEQTEAVLFGEDGLSSADRDDLIVGLHSTLGQTSVQELNKTAKENNLTLVDAPISGGSFGAEEGTLTIMAAGSEDMLDKLNDYFEALGEQIYHFGKEVGMGQTAKLVNNMMLINNYYAYLEGMELGEKFGLDADQIRDFVSVSTGNSFVNENWDDLAYWEDTLSVLELLYKDISTALKEAKEVDHPMPISETTQDVAKQFRDKKKENE